MSAIETGSRPAPRNPEGAVPSPLKTWLPALCAMVCMGLGSGFVGVYGFFAKHLSREFEVGIAVVNIGAAALLLVPGIAAPFVGKLVDRVSIRKLMLLGSGLGMCSLLLVSQAPALAWAGIAFVGFAAGIALYGPVAVNGLLVKLYPGREARALAIAAIGVSFATAALPPLTGGLLARMDWRPALMFIAGGAWVVLWAVILAGIPGDTRGHASGGGGATDSAGATYENSLNPGIYRSREFWLVGLSIALGMGSALVLAISYPPHLIAEGFSVVQAGWVISMMGMAGLVGKGVLALVGDSLRRYAGWIAALIMGLQATGLVLLPSADTLAAVVSVMALLGFTGGAFLPMHSYLNSRYFDASIIGRVTGAQVPLFLPLGLAGPPLAGYIFDQTGSYQIMLYGLAAALALAALLAASLPRSRQRV